MIRELAIPKNLRIKEEAGYLEFEYSLFKLKYLLSLFAAPVSCYFLIQSDFIPGDFQHLGIPVFIILGIAIITMYYALVRLINIITIKVDNRAIKVDVGPLPFGKKQNLKKEDVTQLYVAQHRVAHRYYLYSATYQINVILKDKSIVTLVKGLHSLEQGRFIEHKIEDFLNITDVPVAGEISKN